MNCVGYAFPAQQLDQTFDHGPGTKATEHKDFAVCKVDQPDDAIDERIAQRDQRDEQAERQALDDQGLEEIKIRIGEEQCGQVVRIAEQNNAMNCGKCRQYLSQYDLQKTSPGQSSSAYNSSKIADSVWPLDPTFKFREML